VSLTLTGCAAIPDSTPPEAVRAAVDFHKSAQAPPPQKGIDPLTLVRKFVENSADPWDSYAAAKVYLAPGARGQWNTSGAVTIIDDTFSTVYSTSEDAGGGANVHTVVLGGIRVGRLSADQSFAPETGDFQFSIRVERQPDGEWRIASLPDGAVVSRTHFGEIYRSVRIYYLDRQRDVLVPDVRYIVTQPAKGIPDRVIQLLLAQPSEQLRGAVRSAIDRAATTQTNVAENPDGGYVVDLVKIGDQSAQNRRLVAAQVLYSLQSVTTSVVRLLADGVPLIPGHAEWRPSDASTLYVETDTIPKDNLLGLVVVDKRIRSLADGNTIPGPAGSGEYKVDKAAQSNDGSWLAVVNRTQSGSSEELRVGQFGKPMIAVPLSALDMTRPTWRSGTNNTELWTVLDRYSITRAVSNGDTWTTHAVDVNGLRKTDGAITDLRLSRDGSRAAMVVGGALWVGAVVAQQDSVSITSPRKLLATTLGNSVVSVDWKGADTIVVATSSKQTPVVQVGVDGWDWTPYSSSNLSVPLTAVTAAPSKKVVVADARGVQMTPDASEVWQPWPNGLPSMSGTAVPFYPG
jgi:hypothetical protein